MAGEALGGLPGLPEELQRLESPDGVRELLFHRAVRGTDEAVDQSLSGPFTSQPRAERLCCASLLDAPVIRPCPRLAPPAQPTVAWKERWRAPGSSA